MTGDDDDVTRVVSQAEQAHVTDDPFFRIYNHAVVYNILL